MSPTTTYIIFEGLIVAEYVGIEAWDFRIERLAQAYANKLSSEVSTWYRPTAEPTWKAEHQRTFYPQ